VRALRVVSYNVGGSSRWKDQGAWTQAICSAVAEARPDLLAMQEIRARVAPGLVAGLARIGLVPGDGGARERVFYRPGSLRPQGHRRERVDAQSEDGGERFLNWSRWASSEGFSFSLCNVHLVGAANKAAAARQIADSEPSEAAIIAGDFNLLSSHYVHGHLSAAGWQDAALSALVGDAGPTIHRHGAAKRRRVDWILAPFPWAPRAYGVRRLADVALEPSDHHPIWADLAWDPLGTWSAQGLSSPGNPAFSPRGRPPATPK